MLTAGKPARLRKGIFVASVLCVDDDPEVGRTMQLVLGHGGYAAQLASSAAEGLRLLMGQRFDLGLVDCVPDRERLVEEARRLYPDVRIALYTGHAECESDLPGIDAVLHKPVPPLELLGRLADLLANSRVA